MKDKSIKKKYIKTYVLSFSIPVLISALSYFTQKIYPGGPSTVLLYDMKAQLLALYGYLSNGGPGFDSVFHNMSGGLGGGFLGTFALYISPFDLVYSFVPTSYLPDAIYIMTLLRIGLSGLFCSLYIKKCRIENASDSDVLCVILSCCYALMSYVFMYAMSPMWLDFVMFLPLLALLCERFISDKFSITFILLFSFCIISDYYIAYMVAISLVLYVLFRLIENGDSFVSGVKKFGKFAVSGFMSACLSAFLIIPVVLDFQRGKFVEDNSSEKLILFKNSLLDVLLSFKPSTYNTLNYLASPNIFCGSVVLILVLVWFIYSKKNIKTRIAGAVIVCFYFLSFMLGPLDRVWHGFRNPVGFPVRYAFTFVFFMICFATRGFKKIQELSHKKPNGLYSLIYTLIAIYTFIELYMNGSYILSRLAVEDRFANREEYIRIADTIETLIDFEKEIDAFDYSRTYKNFHYTRFDGALFGFDGLQRFSSSYNNALSAFLSDVGVGTSRHTISDYGITPPIASLLNMGYVLSWHRDYSDYYISIGEYRGYELYGNPDCLPLMFATEITDPDGYEDFSDYPFENINLLFSDLTGYDDLKLFEQIDYTETTRNPEDYYEENTLGFADYVLNPEKDGDYWFYSEYVYPDVDRYKADMVNGMFSTVYPYADYFLDGNNLGTYRNDEFSYCNDLGFLNAGKQYLFSLDASISEIGDTYVYWYNDELAKTVLGQLRSGGYTVDEINGSLIRLSGISEKEAYYFISLPYEKGYSIYVDGVNTDYESYRDSLMLVKIPEGEHEIIIRYMPPGFVAGLTISLLTIIVLGGFVFYDRKIRKKDKNMDK